MIHQGYTSLPGTLYQFVGRPAALADPRWHWKIRPIRIMTRKRVSSFLLSKDRVSSSSESDEDHVSKPNQRLESCNAIPSRNSLQRTHIVERGLEPSSRARKVSIVIDEGSIVRGGRTWYDPPLDHSPTISFIPDLYTFVAASLAAIARTTHICAECAGSLDAFSVYIASKSHWNDGRWRTGNKGCQVLKNDWTSFSAEDFDGRAKEVFVSVRPASSSTLSLGDCLKNGRTSSNSMQTFFDICSRRLNSSISEKYKWNNTKE